MSTSTASSTHLLVLKALAGNPPTSLNAVQIFLSPYVNDLTAFWIAVWCMTAIVLLWRLFNEYREHRKRRDRN